uniref:Aspartate beta-hydroxylase n=1 Tax=Aotus nancymaae TaxID=37293 RepID=A0A2K5DW05_AOTNA
TVTDVGDRFETLEPEVFHEETEHSYHVEETVSQDYNQDMEEMMSEQENPDSSEPVVEDERSHHDTDDVTYQIYEEQVVYEPPENEGVEITEVTVPPEDNAVEDSKVIVEEVSIPPVEEQQEVPPETNRKTEDPEQKAKGNSFVPGEGQASCTMSWDFSHPLTC